MAWSRSGSHDILVADEPDLCCLVSCAPNTFRFADSRAFCVAVDMMTLGRHAQFGSGILRQ